MDYNATKNAIDLGLQLYDYSFLMGLAGLLVGFLFGLGLVIAVLQISRGY